MGPLCALARSRRACALACPGCIVCSRSNAQEPDQQRGCGVARGRHLQNRACHHDSAAVVDRRQHAHDSCAQLLRQQLPRTRGLARAYRRGQGHDGHARARALFRPLHLRHSGHSQGARGQARSVPRHGGLHSVRRVLRRQRRHLRGSVQRAGRAPLGHAQPRVDHRRHAALQVAQAPLQAP
eukprot:Amastigsp_a841711_42.p2 type:complete len:182 gc:universal Amastigsp_a841711_42:1-546(+)